jgi:hypothetical protein
LSKPGAGIGGIPGAIGPLLSYIPGGGSPTAPAGGGYIMGGLKLPAGGGSSGTPLPMGGLTGFGGRFDINDA